MEAGEALGGMETVDTMGDMKAMEACEAAKAMEGPHLRCGTDLIRISRIARALERQGDRFAEHIYDPMELADCGWPERPRSDSLAVRFAAKEAVAKALGTGIGPQGVRWTDIRIVRVPGDAPRISLQGGAARRYDELHGQSISISMSHDGDLALAFCVLGCAT